MQFVGVCVVTPELIFCYYFSILFCLLTFAYTFIVCFLLSRSLFSFCYCCWWRWWWTLFFMPHGDSVHGATAFIHSHLLEHPSYASCMWYAYESVCMHSKPIQFDRLTKRNLNQFIETMQSDRPLFCIAASLSTPYIILQPNSIEVYNTIMEVVNGFLGRYSNFIKENSEWSPRITQRIFRK